MKLRATAITSHSQLFARKTGTVKWPIKDKATRRRDEHLNKFWALLDQGLDLEDFLLGVSSATKQISRGKTQTTDYIPASLPKTVFKVSDQEETKEDKAFKERCVQILSEMRERPTCCHQCNDGLNLSTGRLNGTASGGASISCPHCKKCILIAVSPVQVSKINQSSSKFCLLLGYTNIGVFN